HQEMPKPARSAHGKRLCLSWRGPAAAHKEFKTSILGAIRRLRKGCGEGWKPFESKGLRLAEVGQDGTIYSPFYAQNVTIYGPFSTQKGLYMVTFFMVSAHIWSLFEWF